MMPAIHMTHGIIGSTKAIVSPGMSKRHAAHENRGGEELHEDAEAQGRHCSGPIHRQGVEQGRGRGTCLS